MDKSAKVASRSRIFISYRRQDAAYAADRLAEELRKHFPQDRVFQDMASIEPGTDFQEALGRNLSDCAAALVIIGAGWLTASNRKGQRRLDLADDWVRHEVEESLRRPEVRVFPVLLDTEMPSAEELPEPLRPLARRQAFPLTARHWTNDVDALIEFLKKVPGLAATVVSEAKTVQPPSVHEKTEETVVDTLSIKAQSVPTDFQEDVERATVGGQWGDLRLLADEAQGFEWGVEGVRLAGEALFENHAFEGAMEAFERLTQTLPDDVPANLRLSAIYQSLAPDDSSQSKEKIMDRSEEVIHTALPHATSPKQRAEAFSLLGSSAKARWLDDWRDAEVDWRSHAALGSGYLSDSLGWYLKASNEDAGDFYAGANALALLKIQGSLALKARAVWQEYFDDPDKATIALSEGAARAKQIQESLRRSLWIDGGGEQDPRNPSKAIARAEFLFLTTDKPRQVEHEYRKAVALARNDPFILSAARKNIEPFEMLRLMPGNVTAACGVIDKVLAGAGRIQPQPPERILLFKGLMIDGRERKEPRFPPTRAAQEQVRSMLREAIAAEQVLSDGKIVGVCGGACGGDILFHEVCAELGIATRLYLALPRERFCVKSVQHAGDDWVERYYKLCARLAPRILAESEDLPSWLRERQDYGIWQRADKWMLHNALALHAKDLKLLALWEGSDDDGPRSFNQLFLDVLARGYKMLRLPAELLKTLV